MFGVAHPAQGVDQPLVGDGEQVGEDVEPATMGHAQLDPARAVGGRGGGEALESGHQRLQPLEREARAAEQPGADEGFEAFGPSERREHRRIGRGGGIGSARAGEFAFEEDAPLRIVEGIDLGADGRAPDLAQRGAERTDGRGRGVELQPAGRAGPFEVGGLEPEALGQQRAEVDRLGEWIDGRTGVAAGAEGSDHRRRAERDALDLGAGAAVLLGRAEREAVEEAAPLRVDRLRIGKPAGVLLVDQVEIAGDVWMDLGTHDAPRSGDSPTLDLRRSGHKPCTGGGPDPAG